MSWFGQRRTAPADESAARHVDFWKQDGLRNVIPPGTQQPAGWDEVAYLDRVARLLGIEGLVEIGCGYGRLCRAFDRCTYQGVDINPEAVAKATRENPGYRFQTIGYHDDYPQAAVCMAYTVLLHVDDGHIGDVTARMMRAADRVLVVEILGRHWRKPDNKVPVFNRERGDYEALFTGMTLDMELRRPYRRYPNTEISFLHFVKVASH